MGICYLVGNTLDQDHRGLRFEPQYRQIQSGSDDHLKWLSTGIGCYPQWQAKDPQGRCVSGHP